MDRLLLAIVFAVSATASANPSNYAKEVVVYSARNEQLIKPVFDQFTKETGIVVKYHTDKEAALLQKLKAEGKNSPADVLLTVDAGNLWQAAKEGVLQPGGSDYLKTNIPEHLREPSGLWYGFSIRARTIVYNPKKVKTDELTTYEDLAGDKWKKRLCLRTSQKVYNQSLVAMLIAEHGEKKTEEIVKGWVANLAAPVFPSDNDVIKAVAAGQCDVGIVNTYYFGRMKQEQKDLNAALFWPNQKEKGVHVNISGAGLTKYAPNKNKAIILLEWLATPNAQKMFADSNMEYPVNPKVKPSEEVAAWGEFKQNLINVAKAGELQVAAIKLMDRAGYK